MKTHCTFALATLLACAAFIASAEDAHHPADASASSVESPAPVSAPTTTAMTDQLQKMQAAHDKAAAAQTPEERQAAMQEGMKTLRESMAMMRTEQGTMGCMDMSGAKHGAGPGMMDMMMKMMDQQSSMMDASMKQ